MKIVDELRKKCLDSKEVITLQDFGAGSSLMKSPARKMGKIARYSNSGPKKSRLLSRIASIRSPGNILELGTGLGFQTMYLAGANPTATIWTMEGDPTLAKMAVAHFSKAGCGDKVNLLQGEIGQLLPRFIEECPLLDFVFLDANHQKEATLAYYYLILKKCGPNSIIVVDDIHWSEGMDLAWEEIVNHPDATMTIDLYSCGVVFFDPSFTKQHWVL